MTGSPEMAQLGIPDVILPMDTEPSEGGDLRRNWSQKELRQWSRKASRAGSSFLGRTPRPPWGQGRPTVALMEKARSRLPAVMLKVRSALHPLSASLARMWATKLETGLFSLMVTFMGRFSSTGSLSLMSSTRIPTSI